MAALEMLNIMETFRWGRSLGIRLGECTARDDRGERRPAYADLIKYIGDPRKQEAETAGGNADFERVGGAKARSASIRIIANCEATAGEIPAGNDTTYLSVVDRDGNMV